MLKTQHTPLSKTHGKVYNGKQSPRADQAPPAFRKYEEIILHLHILLAHALGVGDHGSRKGAEEGGDGDVQLHASEVHAEADYSVMINLVSKPERALCGPRSKAMMVRKGELVVLTSGAGTERHEGLFHGRGSLLPARGTKGLRVTEDALVPMQGICLCRHSQAFGNEVAGKRVPTWRDDARQTAGDGPV